MNALIVAALLLVLLGVSYQSGWSRSRNLVTADGVKVHSRPQYHGSYVAIWAMLPALAILALWAWFGGDLTHSYTVSQIPQDILLGLDQTGLNGTITRIDALASGYGVTGEIQPFEQSAGDALRSFQMLTFVGVLLVAAVAGGAALIYARSRVTARLRARNAVERVINIALLACSAVAILTTVGIVASLVTEAYKFFTFINPLDFFFGTVWNPNNAGTAGNWGSYGLLPLLTGTLMITVIAMLVAVPVGLMAAIYLSQYAHPRLRAVAKPMIEILAGIPTIVFGFFALVTVGPFLRDLGNLVGLSINATSALTAGVVMGIMIIPFVSSLSDDILNQVPRTLRDGAYGLGATKSETIRNVLLPAALPGIVGAFLLAVSRAIGETMIVVLAAGNSPVLRGNPFEPVATITVSIVNQLTGDTDFAGPQSLVGFALGLTLFVITLCLNVVALYIVRRFREQYE
ncbi:phosphate ABC transporter permease subunit PstC [Devosia psychrophila]|jgi:phosphate transport system permease protein|uniref:Phosphate transport system permease protein n=1 Tax=Devosia psychrophila TaxID=728005 RepID=A0A0F5PRN3_9HYPH|nr:phosphate ABC transporter permease subunit PstC [Devosia psychrophila]KKC31308.1 ABC transporter permease [Devosia psychrophila]SFC90538.1 phosphate transport system permease protein [Devosia psychrophila]